MYGRRNSAFVVAALFLLVTSFTPYVSEAIVLSSAAEIAAKAVVSPGASPKGAAMCAGFPLPGETYRYCDDITLGLPTWGMCIGPELCLGLGTVSIAGAVIGIGRSILDAGNSGSSGSGNYSGQALTGVSKPGCSGTPFISTTPSSDPCAVYIPTGATTGSVINLGSVTSNPSVSSLLLNDSTGSASSVSSALLNSGTGTGKISLTGQTTGSSLAGTSTLPAGNVSGSLLAGDGSSNGISYSLGANNFGTSVVSGSSNSSPATSNVSDTFLSYILGGTNVSSALSAGADLLNLISGNTNGTAQNISGSLLGSVGTNTAHNIVSISAKPSGVESGTWGDIKATISGVTIIAGTHDSDGRAGTSAFYGYEPVAGIQPQTLARQMCSSRPWKDIADNAAAPPTFFDDICLARGYKTVVVPAPATASTTPGINMTDGSEDVASSSILDTTSKETANTEKSLLSGPIFVATTPNIAIYAVPARVRIGSRSSIYWSAKGVISCVESSPDGNFSGDTLSGAASTVALYSNTEFTVTCVTPDGSSVSKSVTVETSG
jgi:hypothetical protein